MINFFLLFFLGLVLIGSSPNAFAAAENHDPEFQKLCASYLSTMEGVTNKSLKDTGAFQTMIALKMARETLLKDPELPDAEARLHAVESLIKTVQHRFEKTLGADFSSINDLVYKEKSQEIFENIRVQLARGFREQDLIADLDRHIAKIVLRKENPKQQHELNALHAIRDQLSLDAKKEENSFQWTIYKLRTTDLKDLSKLEFPDEVLMVLKKYGIQADSFTPAGRGAFRAVKAHLLANDKNKARQVTRMKKDPNRKKKTSVRKRSDSSGLL